MHHDDDPFGPIPYTSEPVRSGSPPHATANSQDGASVASVIAVGLFLAVAVGLVHAMFVARVGYLFSTANIAIGWIIGYTVASSLPRNRKSLAVFIAVPLTYIAGCLVFLPAIVEAVSRLSEASSIHQQNMAFVHGVGPSGGPGPQRWLLIAGLCLRAPLLAAKAGVGMPALFMLMGLAAAIRASLRAQ
ncbi:MAG: hypothetical protein Q8Q09_16900 [Deltaproteobacteria bacterium]|nr:hypothetical protein [Deltaproteobacteria bacterium]